MSTDSPSAEPTDPIVASAKAQLRPLLDRVIETLEPDVAQGFGMLEMSFFTSAIVQLQQAVEPIQIAEFFVQLSTLAFQGFQFSPVQGEAIDRLLAEAENMAHALSADEDSPH